MESLPVAPVGRPREFEPDEALDKALDVFWRRGYEGTTLSDLTSAMGISRSSLYHSFGGKEQLFDKVLERYTAGPASYSVAALLKPTAREAAEAFLRGAVQATTLPQWPRGCLGVQGALATSDSALPVHDALVKWRSAARTNLEVRFARAVEEGDLPADADAVALARLVITIGFGIAVQAASGLDRDDLNAIVDVAMLSWER